jgi:signal peptidase II
MVRMPDSTRTRPRSRLGQPGPIRLTALVVLLLSLVGCDHTAKLAAERALQSAAPLDVVPGLLELRYTKNDDIAFSMLRALPFFEGQQWPDEKRWMLVAAAALGIALMGAIAWRRRAQATRVELVAWVLVLAGAIGNVIDRVVRGYVVDFVRLPHWPVFNFADVFIVAGALVLLVLSTSRRRVPRH